MRMKTYKEIEELYENWWNPERYMKYRTQYGDAILLFKLISETPIEFEVVQTGDLTDSINLFNFAIQNNYIHQFCKDKFVYQTIDYQCRNFKSIKTI